ncbi:MAG: hypothetical protein M5U19_16085 [Microthrixaceae bacterium]|nr:hypothetical protein [Microthrixaceae bacterium]
MIITGGEKVWPQPVEGRLESHPGVAEAAVVGRADQEWGQAVTALVVPSVHGGATRACATARLGPGGHAGGGGTTKAGTRGPAPPHLAGEAGALTAPLSDWTGPCDSAGRDSA